MAAGRHTNQEHNGGLTSRTPILTLRMAPKKKAKISEEAKNVEKDEAEDKEVDDDHEVESSSEEEEDEEDLDGSSDDDSDEEILVRAQPTFTHTSQHGKDVF